MATKSTGFEVIDEADVQVSRRGRKKEFDPTLLDAIRNLPAGKVLVLKSFGQITDKNKRQTVSNKIRSHWMQVHGEDGPDPRIDWSPETGYAQLRAKAPKADA